MSRLLQGSKLWLTDPDDAYLLGTIRAVSSSHVEIVSEKNQVVRLNPKDASKLESAGSHVDREQDNLVDLDEFSEGAILHHVRKRFLSKTIYTHVGAILVAVNPFEYLDIYSKEEMNRAEKSLSLHSSLYPHVFITAATALSQLRSHNKHQSVLISGESGAGKTETTKKVLEYLAVMSPGGGGDIDDPNNPGMEQKILQSNPLLEALGNAKTRRNDNSSRFGKWMKVDFDRNIRIQGCEIVNYLLEKSRVVGFFSDERNYHIFYQLLAGASPELREMLGLREPRQYRYLRCGDKFTVDSIDDVKDFKEVQAAMNTLQIPSTRQMEMFKVLAAILALGNVTFSTQTDGEIDREGESLQIVQEASILLQLDPTGSSLTTALTEKHMFIKGVLQPPQPYTAAQAADNRDALVKALYSNLFDTTIRHINSTLKSSVNVVGGASAAAAAEEHTHIGVLDIFGFEVFTKNGFEQLCINYCNEKLQSHFNGVIFESEMQMYRDEGVNTDLISFSDVDNSECVALVEGKIGLLCMLDAECSIGTASDVSYVANLEKAFGEVDAFKSSRLTSTGLKICWSYLANYGITDSSRGGAAGGAKTIPSSCSNPSCTLLHARDITDVFPKSTSDEKSTWKDMCKYATDVFVKNRHNVYFHKVKTSKVSFTVKHFAGAVEYTAGREPKQGELSGYSRDWLDKNSDELSALVVECMLQSSSALVQELFAEKAAIAVAAGGAGSAGTKISLGGQFRNQLISLVENLHKTEPHFVRCVKSNNKKKGGVFDGNLVLEQLKYAGLFEAIRIRKAGYAYRELHEDFAQQYLMLVPGLLSERFKNKLYFNAKDACIRILKHAERQNVLIQGVAVVGASKVFIKENCHRTELDHFRRQKCDQYARVLQRFRKYVVDFFRTQGEREQLKLESKRRREQQERENRETEALLQIRQGWAVVVQKYVRRYQVKCYMSSIRDLVDLRKALDPNNMAENKVDRIKDIILRIESQQAEHGLAGLGLGPAESSGRRRASSAGGATNGSGLRQMFAQEVAIARTMIKLIEIQETFRRDMRQAVDDCDVVLLNKLLVRAERLEMGNDRVVADARKELHNLHRRRNVMKLMVAFLKNEYEYSVDPVVLLREASELGIDDIFISKVRRVYDGAGPRLHARARLRTAIETVHRSAVEQGLAEIEAVQTFKGREDFAEAERRSAKLMLRILSFENQLCPEREAAARASTRRFQLAASFADDDDSYAGAGTASCDDVEDSPRITSEMISLCDEICSTPSLEAARLAKRSLQQLANSSACDVEEVVRCYKWSKLICTWKYPEVRLSGPKEGGRADETNRPFSDTASTASSAAAAREPEYEFFGLRPTEARSSVFLMRMLHSELDPSSGADAPPSMQAALGALDLPASVRETMDKLERSHLNEEIERRNEAATEEKERRKKATQGLHGSIIAEKGTGKMTGVTLRRIESAKSQPKKEKVLLKNIKPKAAHAYTELAADLEKKLLESRNRVEKQLLVRDDSLVRLDKYKKKIAFKP